MALGLPILAFRTPGMTVLERGMRYREIAWIELTESVVFTVCAAALVATGSGVWGLAAAFIVRNVVGTAVLVRLAPTGLVLPAARIAPLRDQLAFGGAFQGWLVLVTMRDQLIAFVAALSGGIGALGVWWVAARVLQVPMLAADALWRVSCSAMSRLVAAGVDAKPVVERSSRLAVTLFGIVLVPLVAAGPHLVVSVFGQRWEAAGPAVLWVGLGVFIVSPVTVVAGSLLFAAGAGGTLLRIALVDTVFLAVVEALLLPWLGVPGIAIAWIAAAAVSAILLARAVRMRTGARVLRPTVAPAVIAAVISGTGWLTADAVAHSWPLEVAWMGAAEAAYLLVVAASRRGDLTALLGLARSGATRTFGRESPATAT
jgi:O-antigen/teichoic acid export membrane protein